MENRAHILMVARRNVPVPRLRQNRWDPAPLDGSRAEWEGGCVE